MTRELRRRQISRLLPFVLLEAWGNKSRSELLFGLRELLQNASSPEMSDSFLEVKMSELRSVAERYAKQSAAAAANAAAFAARSAVEDHARLTNEVAEAARYVAEAKSSAQISEQMEDFILKLEGQYSEIRGNDLGPATGVLWLENSPLYYSQPLAILRQEVSFSEGDERVSAWLERVLSEEYVITDADVSLASLDLEAWRDEAFLGRAKDRIDMASELALLASKLRNLIHAGGHNLPPSRIDEPRELLEIANQAEKTSRLISSENLADIENERTKILRHANALMKRAVAYVGKSGDNFVQGAVKSAGIATGATIALNPNDIAPIINRIVEVAEKLIEALHGVLP